MARLPRQPQDTDREVWLEEVRERIEEPGEYIVYEESGEPTVVALTREWTRVGRSLAADVRFDDPTVSRRHALIVRQPDGVRVLDDRSLNGVFVNGERIEWRVLKDGDEIVVGRYRLGFELSGSARGDRGSKRERNGPRLLGQLPTHLKPVLPHATCEQPVHSVGAGSGGAGA